MTVRNKEEGQRMLKNEELKNKGYVVKDRSEEKANGYDL